MLRIVDWCVPFKDFAPLEYRLSYYGFVLSPFPSPFARYPVGRIC